MTDPLRPTLQALLVADHVYTDAATGKKIVTGIFHTIYVVPNSPPTGEQKPGEHQVQVPAGGLRMGSPFAYISLINVRGQQSFAMRYVDLATDDVRFQADFAIECRDPLSPVEMVLPLLPLPTDKIGIFALELLWGNEPLGTYRIQVKVHEAVQGGDAPQ